MTGAQLGLAAVGEADRGVASAIYFTFYYLAGALAGFLPGLTWQAWHWPGVTALAAMALAIGLVAVACFSPSSAARRRSTSSGHRIGFSPESGSVQTKKAAK